MKKESLNKASAAMKIESMEPTREQLNLLREAIRDKSEPNKVLDELIKLTEKGKINVKKSGK